MTDLSRKAFDTLLTEAKAVYDATPALQNFAAWPTDLEFAPHAPQHIPALRQIMMWDNDHPLHTATQAIVPYGHWIQTYTEDDVGYGFLQDYGYIELYGPTGHFTSHQGRAYIAYWGKGLYYPWHHHEAEELYAVISGSGYFEAEGQDPKTLASGDCQFHKSNQPHALTMKDSAILTLILWRGAGMTGLPKMGSNG